MNRIESTFKRLKKEDRAALIPFIVAGDPDLKTTEVLILEMEEAGADIIELGVPFSDPLADGPTIQAGSQRALQNGAHLREILGLAKGLPEIRTPLILMTYYNPVLQYGLKDFAGACREGRIDGVIIPDLPPEEGGPWIKEARRMDLDTIFLASPTSPAERIRLVERSSRGFIYYVSVTGVTGAREKLPGDLRSAMMRIKKHSQKPVAVGFGISTPRQAKEASRFADGVIVGSAIVRIIEENLGNPDLVARVKDFVVSLAQALRP